MTSNQITYHIVNLTTLLAANCPHRQLEKFAPNKFIGKCKHWGMIGIISDLPRGSIDELFLDLSERWRWQTQCQARQQQGRKVHIIISPGMTCNITRTDAINDIP